MDTNCPLSTSAKVGKGMVREIEFPGTKCHFEDKRRIVPKRDKDDSVQGHCNFLL
jgi:hypothetical protein